MKHSNKIELGSVDLEVVCLNASIDLLNSILNPTIFRVIGSKDRKEVSFNDMLCQQYFYIILLDFIGTISNRIIPQKQSALDMLTQIATSPKLGPKGSADKLLQACKALVQWLDKEIILEDIWISSLEKSISLKVKREKMIHISANMAKHGIVRLDRIAADIMKILQQSASCTYEDAILAIPNFEDIFTGDILNYHGSVCAEMLNNVRWGIHEYLSLIYSYVYVDLGSDNYRYNMPEQLDSLLAEDAFWSAINSVRTAPFCPQFTINSTLKLRY